MSSYPGLSTDSRDSGLFHYITELAATLNFEVEERDERMVVRAPCSSPLSFRLERLENQVFAYFACRSTSWSWEGERTDVHDLFSTYLAVRLSAAGLASCSSYDEPHPASHVPGELYARYLVLEQPRKGWYPDDDAGRADLASLVELFAEVEEELHQLGGPCNRSEESEFSTSDEGLMAWAGDVSATLGIEDADEEPITTARANPDWLYYRTADGNRSVVRSWQFALLLTTCARTDVDENEGTSARLVRRGELRNAVEKSDFAEAKSVLEEVNLREADEVFAVPLEDRLVAVEGPHAYSLRADTGRDVYTREVGATLRRNDSFLEWAHPVTGFRWTANVDPKRFEQLTYDLLFEEPNVTRVRFVGSTHDADGGRDLLVDMVTPLTRDEIKEYGVHHGLLVPRRVLVQCKTKRDPGKGVGKSDVLDIRDTIERHGADGYWLVTSTHITAQLVEHLEVLNRKHPHVDWWTRREVEDALVRNPRVAAKYEDVVTAVR
ncbi:restriction endonuclease [Saccharothrix xinjiangensis]|uniref:Restriction endonuclease n=1 Tax=Saccharothrix xinjiangensis TaxID=204798 RepID=A0ABV9XRS9_9PSEU